MKTVKVTDDEGVKRALGKLNQAIDAIVEEHENTMVGDNLITMKKVCEAILEHEGSRMSPPLYAIAAFLPVAILYPSHGVQLAEAMIDSANFIVENGEDIISKAKRNRAVRQSRTD